MKKTNKTDFIMNIVLAIFFAAFFVFGICVFCKTPRYTTIPEAEQTTEITTTATGCNLVKINGLFAE